MIKTILKQLAVIGMVLIPATSFAGGDAALQTLDKPYQIVSDPLHWAETISLVLAIIAIILVIIRVVFARLGIQLGTVNMQLQRFIHLFVLPIFLLTFASFATFEGSTTVEFCGSCHSAMGLYVDDMEDKSSNTLAAVHYQNHYIQHGQCYQCHAGYRVIDIGKAKGSGLLHLYYWITNSPTGTGAKQIELYREGGYQNNLCLRCHSGSKAFLEAGEGVHMRADDYLIEDPNTGTSKMSCLKCHGPAHISLAEKKSPMIFTGKGLYCEQQGINIYRGGEPGKNKNLERSSDGAPPFIPHEIKEYTINRSTNTCLSECHNQGLEIVPASHILSEQEGRNTEIQIDNTRHNCLQCHVPQSDEAAIIPQMDHWKITPPFKFYTTCLLPVEEETFQGVAMCKYCHSNSIIGNQYGKWKNTNHSRAYINLATLKGTEIAREMGVTGNPQESEKCLSCHSTGFNYPEEKGFQFRIEDGVQCEQCHGAGSEYIRLNTMKMLARDELDPETVGHITPEKELCMNCHESEHKHILPFKEEERFKKIAH